jgi:hypothetical protein
MRDSTFNKCFTLLENYHDKKQSAVARARYREEFLGVSDACFGRR